MCNISERLLEERKRLGLNQDQIAEMGGVAKRTYCNYESGEREPMAGFFSAIALVGADVQYILTGQRIVHQAIEAAYPEASNSDYAEIPHYDVQAAAGVGVINTLEELLRPLAFRRDWLAARHLSAANLVIVDVKGESMEPKLQDGDLVLVDKSQIDIASGKTYVLRMAGNLLVKNLQMLPHGQIQVASFNTGFPPYQVDLADESLDMAVIGRVVASMHEW